jgi:hypothetical protein
MPRTPGSALTNRFDATTDPTVNDDITEGYDVGSSWINISTGIHFRCVDETAGAAVWVRLPFDEDTVVVAGGDVVTAAGNVVIVTPPPSAPYP